MTGETKRQRNTGLNRQRIGVAAFELSREQREVSVGNVAERLGVRAPSLYNYVSGLEEIVGLVISELHDRMAVPVNPTMHWADALRLVARTQVLILMQHPRLIADVAREPARRDSAITSLENLGSCLLRAGFSAGTARYIIGTMDLLVIGAAIDASGPQEMYPTAVVTGQGVLQLIAGSFEQDFSASGNLFEFALEQLIASLGPLLDGPRSRVPGQ